MKRIRSRGSWTGMALAVDPGRARWSRPQTNAACAPSGCLMEADRTMRKFFAVAMGSVVALVGFSGAANAFCPPPSPVTTLVVFSGVIPFSGVVPVEVTNSVALTLGTTDVVMEFDPSVLQALAASSATLSGFSYFIDNSAGTVTTASAAFPSDVLGAGDEFCSRWSS